MIQNQRIIFSKNGVNTDLSLDLNDFRSGASVINYEVGTDYLYIASELPFNHKYFNVSVANDVSAIAAVDIWYSRTWNAAVDIIDRTAVSGKSLAQSGVIEWTTNRLKGWTSERDSEAVTGITLVGLYDFYWVRLKFNATLKATTALSYIGYKFSNDTALVDYYPDLANSKLKLAFETGKTSWDDQHLISAETIIRDLKKNGVIASSSQILAYEKFLEPSVHKVAELIFAGLGKAYREDSNEARRRYNEAMNVSFYDVDLDGDGRLSEVERRKTIGFMSR
jgi:hypothetical protein